MNITKLILRTPDPVTPVTHATFNISGAKRTDPYVLKSWAGLDAEEIVSKISGYLEDSDINFYDLSLKERIISLLIKPNPQYGDDISIGDLRDTLYRAISYTPQAKLELMFYEGGTYVASLFGVITKLEGSHFSDNPEIQITFKCSDPFLRSNDEYSLSGFLAEFDPDAPSWTDSFSTAPHGYRIEFEFSGAVTDPVITTSNGTEFVIAHSFIVGDVLHLSSEYNNKYLYIVNGAVTTHIADKIVSGSVWPFMFPGVSGLTFSDVDMNASIISWYTAYWGV